MASWDMIFSAGTVVRIQVSMWGGRTKLTAADLGIADSPEVREALSLGTHRLVAPETLAPIQNAAAAARRVLADHSAPFGFLADAGARFVPEKNLEKCLRKVTICRKAFDEAVEGFVAGYEAAKAAQLPILREALRRAAHSEEAARDAMTRVEAEYPTAEAVRAAFSIKTTVFAVAAPRGAAAAEALANEGENVKDVIGDIIRDAREKLSARVGEIIALIERGGKVPTRSIEPTRELLARLADMNVTGDRELDASIARVREFLDRAQNGFKSETSSLEEVKAALSGSIDDAVRDAEAALTSVGKRRFAVMEGGE
jgi:hypothetical protein